MVVSRRHETRPQPHQRHAYANAHCAPIIVQQLLAKGCERRAEGDVVKWRRMRQQIYNDICTNGFDPPDTLNKVWVAGQQ
jgi:hypothetical protein